MRNKELYALSDAAFGGLFERKGIPLLRIANGYQKLDNSGMSKKSGKAQRLDTKGKLVMSKATCGQEGGNGIGAPLANRYADSPSEGCARGQRGQELDAGGVLIGQSHDQWAKIIEYSDFMVDGGERELPSINVAAIKRQATQEQEFDRDDHQGVSPQDRPRDEPGQAGRVGQDARRMD